MHRQDQLSPRVSLIDFRQNCELKGIDSIVKVQTKDVGLILDKLQANESKIQQLLSSINAMKQDQNWEIDQKVLSGMQQNYELMIKLSGEMKESIQNLLLIKYKAESKKIEEIIELNRIKIRQDWIIECFNEFENTYGRYIERHIGQEQRERMQQLSQQNEGYVMGMEWDWKEQGKEWGQNKKQKQQDEGIYL